MKALDSMWFSTTKGHFGLVVGQDSFGTKHLYAGIVGGKDQHLDEIEILNWGTKVNISMLKGLMDKVDSNAKPLRRSR